MHPAGPSEGGQIALGIPGIEAAIAIGRGGFATVYRATQQPFGRPVAVKVLALPLENDDARRRFTRECRLIGLLGDHPNIVSVFDAGELADGRPYLVMRYLPGGSLHDRIRAEGPLEPTSAATIGARLARALDTAHRQGVVHCDVKPANVLLTADGEPQLVDFGVAAATDVGDATMTRTLGGTPAYLPPEALDGEAPAPSRDVYSLAATLHAGLTGQAPFSSPSSTPSLAALMKRIADDQPQDLTEVGVPADIATAIAAGLAKEPEDRPTAAAFADQLDRAVSQSVAQSVAHIDTQIRTHPGPTPTPPPEPPTPKPSALADEPTVMRAKPQPPEPHKPRRAGIWAAAATVIALVVTGMVWNATRSSSPSTTASTSSVATSTTGVADVAPSASTAPASTAPAPVVTVPAEGDGGSAAAAPLNRPLGMSFGPDGSLYVADTGHHRIRRISPAGIITTVAGTGTAGLTGDGAAAAGAQLNEPRGVTVTSSGVIYIADTSNHRVRRIETDGVITSIAGKGDGPGYDGDGGQATRAMLSFPTDLAVDADGSLLVTEVSRIRRIRPDGVISTFAGTGATASTGDGGPATAATFVSPWGIEVASDRSVLVFDSEAGVVRKISTDGVIATVAGNGACCGNGDGGPATAASIWRGHDVALGRDGSIFVTESGTNSVRRIGTEGVITTVAGSGSQGADGDGGLASTAAFAAPQAIAIGPNGSLYIADTGNNRIRVIGGDGIVTTFAGITAP